MLEKQKPIHPHRFWTILKEYWVSEEKWFALPILGGILFIILALVQLLVRLNVWQSDFYNALEQKNYSIFLSKIVAFLPLVFAIVFCYVVISFGTNFLAFRWRSWLTQRYIVRWFEKSAYYHIFNQAEPIDNPDQRLSQDIASFTSGVLDLFVVCFREIITLISFVGILWKISADFQFQFKGHNFTIPGYLLWIAIIYSACGTLGIMKIGRSLVKLDFEQEKCEADFRYGLIRIREYREEIAMQGGEEFEKLFLQKRFFKIVQNYYKILKQNIFINAVQNAYLNLSTVFPLLAGAPLYFSGKISLGSLMRIPGAFSTVLNAFSLIIKQYQTLARLKATINRITSFVEKMEEAHEFNDQTSSTHVQLENSDQDKTQGIFVPKLFIVTPTGQVIHQSISLDVKPGERILITGRSGLGKSSLFRVLRGLWSNNKEKIIIPQLHCFFLPQKPYQPFATLRECLNYPRIEQVNTDSDTEIYSLLERLNLEKWIPYLDQEADWQKTLSLGEQQRFQFIRCILNKPRHLFMDEPTSALDSKNEKKAFELLFEKLPGITLLTIGHSQSLKEYHDRVVVLGE